jgi:hypothetical protein
MSSSSRALTVPLHALYRRIQGILGRNDTRKIAIFGQYKTGTTALFYLIRNSLPASTRTLFEPNEYVAEPDDVGRMVLAKVILGVPDGVHAVRYETFTGFDRKLYLVRDPRDWVVSGTLFIIQQDRHVYGDEETLRAVMALLRQKERDPRSTSLVRILGRIIDANPDNSLERLTLWMRRQLAWLIEFEARLDDSHRLRYEDLVTGHLHGLESYLQMPCGGSSTVEAEHAHVPRTKSYGNWRSWFTEEDVAYFRPVFTPYMSHYGYADEWRLDDSPTIPAEHCSEYVERAVRKRKSGAASTPRTIVEPYLHVDADRISNPLTGQMLRSEDADASPLRALREGKITVGGLPDDTRQRLLDHRWLVADRPDLSSRFALRYVSLEASTGCNQACYFCPVSVDPRPDYSMPTDRYESIVGQLAAYRDTIETVFMINYNEPTMDKRFLDQVRTLKAHGLPPAVLTNGSGLTPATVDTLMELGGLRFLSVNLSTLDRQRYQHDRGADHLPLVLRNLDYAKTRRIAPQMDMVVLGRGDATHKSDVEEIRERFAGSCFEVKGFEVMDRAGRLPVGRKPPAPHARLGGCDNVGSRPLQHLHITPHGKCVLCCEDYDEKYVVGDLTTQTVAEVLAGPEIAKLRRWSYGQEEAPADFICRHCVFARSQ